MGPASKAVAGCESPHTFNPCIFRVVRKLRTQVRGTALNTVVGRKAQGLDTSNFRGTVVLAEARQFRNLVGGVQVPSAPRRPARWPSAERQ